MTVDQMRRLKQEYGLSYETISKETGVPYSTVSKILMGITKSPRQNTIARMSAYFRKLQRFPESETQAGDTDSGDPAAGERLQEKDFLLDPESAVVRIPGAHTDRLVTFSERESLPEQHRTELIDGVLYDMAAPQMQHQDLIRLMSRQIDDCIRRSGDQCRVYFAPSDVVLKETDPATVLQPDLDVICHRDRIRDGRYYGAPKFVIEVLSPSTKRKDLTVKLQKYADAGVSEYWMVDPDGKKVIVCDLESCRDEGNPSDMIYLYGFEHTVPVLSSGGTCFVDFAAISRDMEEFYG